MVNYTEKENSLIFNVRIVPRASKSEIVGAIDGALKIRIASPPVDGAANTELVKLLAKVCGVAKSQIEIVVGQTSRTKQIKISGLGSEKFKELIK